MLDCLDFVRDIDLLSVTVRMVLAVICGGLIGIEREYKRRPAGFRTHILICLGAAMTTLTSQYLYLNQGLFTDISRLGAQAIAGIGFIGAGTIIVTKHQRVKGLTTAAGLWTAAIIGLVCGAGYVECALFATVMVLVAELLLIRIEYRFAQKAQDVNLYIEYSEAKAIEDIARLLREKHLTMKELEISRVNKAEGEMSYCAIIGVRFNKKQFDDGLVKAITAIPNVTTVEEL
jgi:putative Mg2+ transporter-C (MgtC) family protein